MKKEIIYGLLAAAFFSGCVHEPKPKVTLEKVVVVAPVEPKSKIDELVQVEESKYVKILIMPFKNANGDLDYGGYLKTKLHESRLVFNRSKTDEIINYNIINGVN